MAQNQIQTVNWWHERMADMMLANPDKTLTWIAKELGVTLAWLSTVKHSDCFIDYWRVRSAEHSRAVTMGIKEKLAGTTEMVLDNLQNKVSDLMELDSLSVDQSLDILNTLNKYGYGQKKEDAPTINFNLGLASPEMLATARRRLRGEDSPPLELTAVPEKATG